LLEYGVTRPAATARDADVRGRIFASALHHFSRKGFAATSLREVAEDAQTTKPMIYYYFNSKDGLYASVVREILEEKDEAIAGSLPAGGSAAEQVMAFCKSYMDHFLANEDTIALILREVLGLGGVPLAALAETLAERVRHPLDEILLRGMERGELLQGSAGECATALTGIMDIFILAHVLGGSPIDRERPLRQVEHYVRGLKAGA
jgi:TetR/AcrR family transcriptional regulator